jgi:catechol 2,3-dioxygenase-like lactoylglutathione lyase family enzyme
MIDTGWTHIALSVKDIKASIAFYQQYADMFVVHERKDSSSGLTVSWLTDPRRVFVLVLMELPDAAPIMTAMAHLGIACVSREEVDARCARAKKEGRQVRAPQDSGPPVGYWAFISDPDGNNLEVSYGQEIGMKLGDSKLG